MLLAERRRAVASPPPEGSREVGRASEPATGGDLADGRRRPFELVLPPLDPETSEIPMRSLAGLTLKDPQEVIAADTGLGGDGSQGEREMQVLPNKGLGSPDTRVVTSLGPQ